MLDEDQADNVMSDIHYMTQQGWTEMLQHLTELHKIRDKVIHDRMQSFCSSYSDEISDLLWEMNYGD